MANKELARSCSSPVATGRYAAVLECVEDCTVLASGDSLISSAASRENLFRNVNSRSFQGGLLSFWSLSASPDYFCVGLGTCGQKVTAMPENPYAKLVLTGSSQTVWLKQGG